MEIIKVEIDGKDYRIFNLKINGEYMNIAEESLDECVLECVAKEQYHKVKHIDEMYGYVVDQDIADAENEDEIRECVEDMIDDYDWINKYKN